MISDIAEEKIKLRKQIYSLLLKYRVARPPFPIEGRIPNFVGAEAAARRLVQEEIFRKAEVAFSNPDSPQRPVREAVLRQGKLLVMASPRLRKGFLVLDPRRISPSKYGFAATIRGAFSLGEVRLDIPPIDLKVVGSVAVDTRGGRVGKGGGYSDLEYAILRELGLVSDDTPIVTTVHDLQVVEKVPVASHDVPVDQIFTPTKVIRCSREYPRPPGIIPEILSREEVELIPLLKLILERRKAF